MFDSDDEETFSEVESSQPVDNYQQPPQPIPYNASSKSQTAPRWGASPSLSISSAQRSPFAGDEEDPFKPYRGQTIYNGIIITGEILPHISKEFSFYVFCQENQVIFGIPRRLTTPIPRQKLNSEQRWRKQWDLEFGRKLEFILDQYQRVLTYKKGSSDLVEAEVIDSRKCVSLSLC